MTWSYHGRPSVQISINNTAIHYRDWATYLVELQRKYTLRRPGAKDVIAQVLIGE